MTMTYSVHDLFGNIGVVMILGSYLWIQAGRTTVNDLSYSVVNGVGAALILVSLLKDFNLSAFVVEAAWVAVSVFGAIRILRAKRVTSRNRGG